MKSLYLFLCTAIFICQQWQTTSLKYDDNNDNNVVQILDTNTDIDAKNRRGSGGDSGGDQLLISDKYLSNFIKRLLMKTSINHQLINQLSNRTTSTLSLIKHNKRLTAATDSNHQTRDSDSNTDRVTRNEDFLGSRGRRQHSTRNEKKLSNDFLGSRGKKYEEFLGSRGRRGDEEFLGSRGRRINVDDGNDHTIARRIEEEFLGSRGRRMDDFLGSRGKRSDEFYGSRGRRHSYVSSSDCRDTNDLNDCDASDLASSDNPTNYLLNGYDNYLKQYLHQQMVNDENSLTMLINKKSNKNNQQTRVDTQIVREPFWAHRGKKDNNYHRQHVNSVWHNDVLFADEPYWVLVVDDTDTVTTTRRTKNNHFPLINDHGPSPTDDAVILNNDNPFILSRG